MTTTISWINHDAAHNQPRESTSIFVGVAFAALGNLLVNFGTNLMKLGMANKTKKVKKRDSALRAFCPNITWRGHKLFDESMFVWLGGAAIFVVSIFFTSLIRSVDLLTD